MSWLEVERGAAPLIVAFPHTGTDIPEEMESRFVSGEVARHDTDWWVHRLYDFAADLGATTVRTRLSRSVIDVNRDPSGASLYPGQATTELCPTTTFDGAPLYAGPPPDAAEIALRRERYFDPYHAALSAEIERLHARHGQLVLYDAHSIRSRVPRLFDGELPQFNIGTNGGTTCSPRIAAAVEEACAASGHSHVLDGRFRGGWTTRHYGRPADGIHAIQMELATRGYLDESIEGPPPFDAGRAAGLRPTLLSILEVCLSEQAR